MFWRRAVHCPRTRTTTTFTGRNAIIFGSLFVLLCPCQRQGQRLASALVVPILRQRQSNLSHRMMSTSTTGSTSVSYVTTCDPIPAHYLPSWIKPERTRVLTSQNDGLLSNKNDDNSTAVVVYWMQRDVRTVDNWALLLAEHVAKTHQLPLHVVHVLNSTPNNNENNDSSSFPPDLETMKMTERHGSFLLGGLALVHEELRQKQVPLHVLHPPSQDSVATTLLQELFHPAVVICDFSPIRHVRQWMEIQLLNALLLQQKQKTMAVWQVDTHNVVPVWFAADKRQVGARTLRPKLHKVVNSFMKDECPLFEGNSHLQEGATSDMGKKKNAVVLPPFDYEAHKAFLDWDTTVPEIPTIRPGTQAAQQQLESFFHGGGLARFDTLRNDPNFSTVCSNLSPWLNHGHISFQYCLKMVKKNNKYASGSASYIEEGLVRKELSDNFLYYTPDDYDKLSGAADWARESLELHAADPRDHVYSLAQLERAQTHDDLWNAAQLQLVQEGGMHGFLRMYWAKKILEWTESPALALRTAQYFNDQYALDGRDPNGFVGVGWSIMGIHDMGWKERPIFGKIRFMNYAGCKRKFKVADFVAKYPGAAENAAKAVAGWGVPVVGAAAVPKPKKRKAPPS